MVIAQLIVVIKLGIDGSMGSTVVIDFLLVNGLITQLIVNAWLMVNA